MHYVQSFSPVISGFKERYSFPSLGRTGRTRVSCIADYALISLMLSQLKEHKSVPTATPQNLVEGLPGRVELIRQLHINAKPLEWGTSVRRG